MTCETFTAGIALTELLRRMEMIYHFDSIRLNFTHFRAWRGGGAALGSEQACFFCTCKRLRFGMGLRMTMIKKRVTFGT